MKQTAVEWFYENLKNLIKESELTDIRPSDFDMKEKELIQQAKDMEMNQIKEAFDDGFQNKCDADLYFNKKFKPGYKNEN